MHHEKPVRFKILIELEGETSMGQITVGPFNVNVGPSTPPPTGPTANPTTGTLPQETEGVADAGDLVATISGGTPPYAFSNIAGLPPGMQLNEGPSADGVTGDVDVTISGTPSAGDSTGGDGAGNYSITFTVTDAAGATAQVRATKPLGSR
jgi:hypothetical protein